MAELRACPVRPVVQTAIEEQRPANPGAEGQVSDGAEIAPCPKAALADRQRVDIVIHAARHAERPLKRGFDIRPRPARQQVGRRDDDAGAGIDLAACPDTNRGYRLPLILLGQSERGL